MEITRFKTLPSTNLMALELGAQGAPDETVVLANTQEGGRGRLGRSFASPPGGLYMSILLRPDLMPEQLSLVTLAAGVACCRTVEQITGLEVLLKWPNDLYVDKKKLAGILTESAPFDVTQGKIPYVVVGVGLNVNTPVEKFPPVLQESATSVYCLCRQKYDPEQFVPGIVSHLRSLVAALKNEHGNMLQYWQERDYLRGRDIIWHDPAGTSYSGTGAGLHHDGCYKLRKREGGVIFLRGGELSLAKP